MNDHENPPACFAFMAPRRPLAIGALPACLLYLYWKLTTVRSSPCLIFVLVPETNDSPEQQQSMGRADFDVFVEDRRVVAGSKLHGSVYLDAAKQIAGSAVIVRLTGQESTVVRFEEGDWSRKKMVPEALKPVVKGVQGLMDCFDDNRRYERHRSKDATVRILSVEVPVGSEQMISNQKIEAGKYKLPFEIDLPSSLPASMHVSHRDEGDCEIQYEIEAHLKGSGWFSDYKANRQVFIQAKPVAQESKAKIPFEGPPQTMPIRLLKCKAMGEMTYGCLLDNTVLACGESAQVSIACQNHSTLGISSVSAKLLQITRWEAGRVEAKHEATLVNQTMPDWKELQPLSAEEFQQRQSATQTNNNSDIESKILTDLKSGSHNVIIRVPQNASPTYEGQVIRIQHILRVQLVSSYYLDFVAPCPKVDIPVQILASDRDTLMPEFDIPAWANDVANLVVASAVYIPSQAINYGGDTMVEDDESPGTTVPTDENEEPALAVLLGYMKKTTNHQGLILQKTKDERWKHVFATLSADDYGRILGEVQLDFRKPDIAEILAQSIATFTCHHAVQGAKASPDWMRGAVIGTVLPYITDLDENKSVLVSQLSDWEKLLLEEALKNHP